MKTIYGVKNTNNGKFMVIEKWGLGERLLYGNAIFKTYEEAERYAKVYARLPEFTEFKDMTTHH